MIMDIYSTTMYGIFSHNHMLNIYLGFGGLFLALRVDYCAQGHL